VDSYTGQSVPAQLTEAYHMKIKSLMGSMINQHELKEALKDAQSWECNQLEDLHKNCAKHVDFVLQQAIVMKNCAQTRCLLNKYHLIIESIFRGNEHLKSEMNTEIRNIGDRSKILYTSLNTEEIRYLISVLIIKRDQYTVKLESDLLYGVSVKYDKFDKWNIQGSTVAMFREENTNHNQKKLKYISYLLQHLLARLEMKYKNVIGKTPSYLKNIEDTEARIQWIQPVIVMNLVEQGWEYSFSDEQKKITMSKENEATQTFIFTMTKDKWDDFKLKLKKDTGKK
jgi:hypothetical protein